MTGHWYRLKLSVGLRHFNILRNSSALGCEVFKKDMANFVGSFQLEFRVRKTKRFSFNPAANRPRVSKDNICVEYVLTLIVKPS